MQGAEWPEGLGPFLPSGSAHFPRQVAQVTSGHSEARGLPPPRLLPHVALFPDSTLTLPSGLLSNPHEETIDSSGLQVSNYTQGCRRDVTSWERNGPTEHLDRGISDSQPRPGPAAGRG